MPAPLGGYAFLLQFTVMKLGETITLQFYDDTDTVYDVEQTYEFVSDMVLGNVVAPEQLTLSVPSADDGGDDCASGVYDCAGVCDGTSLEDCLENVMVMVEDCLNM